MGNRIKIKGTIEKTFDIGLTNKQVFDASAFTANRTWVLPDSDGSDGHALTTDGAGTLAWANVVGVPYLIATATTFTVPLYYQVLFSFPITIDGTLTVDGKLIEVD